MHLPPLTISLWLYLALLVAVGLERILELVISRRNARIQLARGAVEVGTAHFRAMTLVHAAFLPACFAEAWLLERTASLVVGLTALLAALAAQGLRWWAVTTLGTRWNVRVIAKLDDAPIHTGPYKVVRHPNYLAVALEMFSLPLVHGAFVTAIVFTAANALLMRVRIPAEERALGKLYAEQFAATPRLWPKGSDAG